jgi:hypothetical protein
MNGDPQQPPQGPPGLVGAIIFALVALGQISIAITALINSYLVRGAIEHATDANKGKADKSNPDGTGGKSS